MDAQWRTVESDRREWDHAGLPAERFLVFINGSGRVTAHREVVHLVSVQRVILDNYTEFLADSANATLVI